MSPYFVILRAWLITLVYENAVAALWGLREKRAYLVVFLVNTLTNPLLNVLLRQIGQHYSYDSYRLAVPVLEVLIWAAEGFLFRRFLPEIRHPFLFSLSLNAASYLFGGETELLLRRLQSGVK
ncbi:MAG: hypothetical protein Q4B03_04685 [Lachnospiraceae bacterium]|nr:hypothetical protein [Lachnospiraceae bacterium]